MLKVLVLLVTATLVIGQTTKFPLYDDYKSHKCIRDCTAYNFRKEVCEYDFTIEWLFTLEPACRACLTTSNDCPECIKADGEEKIIMVYNRQLPGPAIHVCQGDTVVVNLRNNLGDTTTSIHWHGMHQRNSQWMDGVPMVTQCGIHPYTTFQYRFDATEVGTHFYHSHSATQRCEGAFGALIVHKTLPEFHLAYDLPEHVILLNDWFFETAHHHIHKDDRYRIVDDNVVASILINGVGSNGTNRSPLPKIFSVDYGQRYRFRVIQAGCKACNMELSIQGHRITMVAADGNDVIPIPVDSITIMNGERYDFILEANRTIDNYVIRVQGGIHCNNRTSYAILKYRNARNVNVNVQAYVPPSNRVRMNCVNTPRNSMCYNYDNMTHISQTGYLNTNAALYRAPQYQYFVGFDIKNYARKFVRGPGQDGAFGAMINNIFMTMPSTPLLQKNNQPMCNYENVGYFGTPNAMPGICSGGHCECVHGIDINLNTLVELIFVDEGTLVDINHPFHLHGYQFIVLAQQKLGSQISVDTIRQMDRAGRLTRNFNSPVVKDTISVPDGGYVIVRFMANNPGYWLMHCHVDFHVEMGMQMVIKTGNVSGMPADFPKCGDYYPPQTTSNVWG